MRTCIRNLCSGLLVTEIPGWDFTHIILCMTLSQLEWGEKRREESRWKREGKIKRGEPAQRLRQTDMSVTDRGIWHYEFFSRGQCNAMQRASPSERLSFQCTDFRTAKQQSTQLEPKPGPASTKKQNQHHKNKAAFKHDNPYAKMLWKCVEMGFDFSVVSQSTRQIKRER